MLTWQDFEKVDIRVGTICTAEPLLKAKKPAYKLTIDFGPLGILKSSAQITHRYTINELPGMQILAVVNFPPKQIADFMSQCLVLGVVQDDHSVILIGPKRHTDNGLRIA